MMKVVWFSVMFEAVTTLSGDSHIIAQNRKPIKMLAAYFARACNPFQFIKKHRPSHTNYEKSGVFMYIN